MFPANANDHINLVQPAHGWFVPIGFLFETDSLQHMAMVGLDIHDHFPSLVQAFGALRTGSLPQPLEFTASMLHSLIS